MSIVIPRRRIAKVTVRPLLFSGEQEGTLGGPTLAVPRLGDRFAADIETAKLGMDADSLDLGAALFEAAALDARIAIDQPTLPAGRAPISAAVVDGANQAGNAIALRGLAANTGTVRRGQLWNILHAGTRYLFMATATRVANGAGKLTLPIWPMLRFLTVDGAACEFDAPVIEGKFTLRGGMAWSANRTEPVGFTIEERA